MIRDLTMVRSLERAEVTIVDLMEMRFSAHLSGEKVSGWKIWGGEFRKADLKLERLKRRMEKKCKVEVFFTPIPFDERVRLSA